METAPLRYLSGADVLAAMPGIEERLALAETTMVALVDDAELPPKIGVHPGPDGSFAHAMPAWMRGPTHDHSGDLLGIKWVVGFPSNQTLGLPAIHATAVLSDATTGLPRAIMDAGGITALRTAAVSGAAISRWGPAGVLAGSRGQGGGSLRVAIIGAGVQARSHLPVIDHLVPGATLVVCDRDPKRLATIVEEIQAGAHGSTFSEVQSTSDAVVAVDGAALVVTVVSFGPDRQAVPEAAFSADATVVAVDYDMCVPASVARDAALFLTDDREQFLANRTDAQFAGYPEPMAMIGQAIGTDTQRPDGRVLVSHLGVGLADVVFADAILRRAETEGIGVILDR